MGAADVPFALEVGQMLVDRGERVEGKMLGDFLERGGIAVGPYVAFQVV
jgi:hypothetical protein